MRYALVYDMGESLDLPSAIPVGCEPWRLDEMGHWRGVTEESWWDDRYVVLEVDTERDTVEWTPPIGPNPIWRAVWSEVRDDPMPLLDSWISATF